LEKIGHLVHKLGTPLRKLGKGQQFLADQVIQRVGETEAVFDAPRGLALSD
jgi:hypothetical protein